MIFVVPQFRKVFENMGVTLPAITETLITASNLVLKWWWAAPAVIIAVVIAYKIFTNSKLGKLIIDKTLISLPLFGNILRKSSISRFARTLGTLISSGVPILEALGIVKNAISNRAISDAVANVHSSIKEGGNIARPLAESGEFDEIVVNMIDVGEETGELDKMFTKIADNYDEEVDILIGSMVDLMEPILIITMGLVIGFIVIALFMPLIQIVQNIG